MKLKRVDIMVDIETLGKDDNATVFQISAIPFNLMTGEYVEDLSFFNEIADIAKNKQLNVDGDTLKWWLNTDKELLTELLNAGAGSSEDIVCSFHSWLENIVAKYGRENVYLWGNGILFDNRILKKQIETIGLHYPIFYRNDRDVRTILESASFASGLTEQKIKDLVADEKFVAHNALDDVKKQINLVSVCYKLITVTKKPSEKGDAV